MLRNFFSKLMILIFSIYGDYIPCNMTDLSIQDHQFHFTLDIDASSFKVDVKKQPKLYIFTEYKKDQHCFDTKLILLDKKIQIIASFNSKLDNTSHSHGSSDKLRKLKNDSKRMKLAETVEKSDNFFIPFGKYKANLYFYTDTVNIYSFDIIVPITDKVTEVTLKNIIFVDVNRCLLIINEDVKIKDNQFSVTNKRNECYTSEFKCIVNPVYKLVNGQAILLCQKDLKILVVTLIVYLNGEDGILKLTVLDDTFINAKD